MGKLQEEMMINIKSSTCEEEEFTKIRLLPVGLKFFEFGKTLNVINEGNIDTELVCTKPDINVKTR